MPAIYQKAGSGTRGCHGAGVGGRGWSKQEVRRPRKTVQEPLAGHTIFANEAYLIPTGQGNAILGTTVEFAGYDKRSTVSGIRIILSGVSEVVPSIGSAALLHTWAGLRPATPDEQPLFGPHPGGDGDVPLKY